MKRYIDIAMEEIIKEKCPGEMLESYPYAPVKDYDTQLIHKHVAYGCMGITCKQCWEMEIPEQKEDSEKDE